MVGKRWWHLPASLRAKATRAGTDIKPLGSGYLDDIWRIVLEEVRGKEEEDLTRQYQ